MLKQVVNIPGLEYLECHAAVALATLASFKRYLGYVYMRAPVLRTLKHFLHFTAHGLLFH